MFSAGTEERAVIVASTLSEVAAQYSVSLTRFAYLICGDRQRAEDLVQDAFLAVYRRFGDVLSLAAPEAYLRRTIVNAHLAATRRRASSELPTDQMPDSPTSPEDPSDRDAMWRALGTLPARQRAVLVLRYYLDLPDPTIADLLSCRRGTVRSLAARAFAALRVHPDLAEES